MSDLSKMAATPITRMFAGRELTFSPLTLDELARFDEWLKQVKQREAVEALGPDATAQERVQVIRETAAPINIVESSEAMQSLRGIRQLLYMALQPHYPDCTPEEVGRLINLQNLGEAKELLDQLIGLQQNEETNSPPARKRSARGRP